MPFSLFEPELWIGLVSGGASVWLAKLTGKQSREAQLEKFKDDLFATIQSDLEECRKGHEEMLVVKTCLRLALPEMVRRDPTNPVLNQVGSLLRGAFGEADGAFGDFHELLQKLSAMPYHREGQDAAL